MIELIREEAREIIARARAAEVQIKADAEEAANLAREHHERLVAELDSRREEMENEHRNLMEHAKAQVETMEQRAEDHRQHLDREAAGVRRQAETQFERAIAFRRSEVTRVIADAERQVGTLHEMRIRLTTELRTCRELLADALPLLHPLPDETPPDLPEQRGVLPANPTSNSRNTSAPRTTTNNLPRPQPAH
jgi:hypothetical protein